MTEYHERRYRQRARQSRLTAFEAAVKETDLLILADSDLTDLAVEVIHKVRGPLEGYIAQHADFLQAMTPLPSDHLAPPIVREMLSASQSCGIGPMSAVAGAIAEEVGLALLERSREVVVENGGDCYIKVNTPLDIGIFAGRSGLSEQIAVRVQPEQTPMGVCTSSGTVGHSLSLGRADAVTVLAASAALADAAATMTGNQVRSARDIQQAVDTARQVKGVTGVIVVVGDQIGAWGEVELVPMAAPEASKH